MERAIVHMDLDSFFVSVERLKDRSLYGKPLIIGGLGDRSVVSSCSYEARTFGVHSAMPMSQARRLCPQAVIIGGDMHEYSRYSALVTQVVNDAAPLVEKASIDEFYLDISGMDRFFGAWKWSLELKQRIIRETGLPISFALSTGKTVAKIGTGQSKPDGQLHIPAGRERDFLAPLSVRKIPMIGEKTYGVLQKLGIETIGDVQRFQPDILEKALGKSGRILWNKAHAIDLAPVQPHHEQKSISKEHTFEKDTDNLKMIHDLLTTMTEKLAFSLRRKNKLTGCLTVKIRYGDFETQSHQHAIPYTSVDHDLFVLAHQLFNSLYRPGGQIRLIGLRLSDLVNGAYQIRLFEDSPAIHDLYMAMDKMRTKFGSGAVKRANSLGTGFREHD